jgi:acetoin utilization protein AcuB
MTRNVLTTLPEASLRDAARVMLDARIGSLPVVDASGKLLGMLTRSDVLQAVVELAPFDVWG